MKRGFILPGGGGYELKRKISKTLLLFGPTHENLAIYVLYSLSKNVFTIIYQNSTKDNCTIHLGNTETLLNFSGYQKIWFINHLPVFLIQIKVKKKKAEAGVKKLSICYYLSKYVQIY